MHVWTLTGITSIFLSMRILSAAIVVGPFAPSAITCTCTQPEIVTHSPPIPNPSHLLYPSPPTSTYLCLHIPSNVCSDLLLYCSRNKDVTFSCQQVLLSCCGSGEAHDVIIIGLRRSTATLALTHAPPPPSPPPTHTQTHTHQCCRRGGGGNRGSLPRAPSVWGPPNSAEINL